MGKHVRTRLSTNSSLDGQRCPVTRELLALGQEVIICETSETIFSLSGWEYLGGTCVFCGEVALPLTSTGALAPIARPVMRLPGGEVVALERDIINIGRAVDNDIVLRDGSVSKYHSRLRSSGDFYYLFDLASTNGTYVNDQRFQRLLLRDGDRIRMGNTVLVFGQHAPKEVRPTGKAGDTLIKKRKV